VRVHAGVLARRVWLVLCVLVVWLAQGACGLGPRFVAEPPPPGWQLAPEQCERFEQQMAELGQRDPALDDEVTWQAVADCRVHVTREQYYCVMAATRPDEAAACVDAPPTAPPTWRASVEKCRGVLNQALALGQQDHVDAAWLRETYADQSSEGEIAECIMVLTERQYDCVMAATSFADIGGPWDFGHAGSARGCLHDPGSEAPWLVLTLGPSMSLTNGDGETGVVGGAASLLWFKRRTIDRNLPWRTFPYDGFLFRGGYFVGGFLEGVHSYTGDRAGFGRFTAGAELGVLGPLFVPGVGVDVGYYIETDDAAHQGFMVRGFALLFNMFGSYVRYNIPRHGKNAVEGGFLVKFPVQLGDL